MSNIHKVTFNNNEFTSRVPSSEYHAIQITDLHIKENETKPLPGTHVVEHITALKNFARFHLTPRRTMSFPPHAPITIEGKYDTARSSGY
jgi:hypothetical protein